MGNNVSAMTLGICCCCCCHCHGCWVMFVVFSKLKRNFSTGMLGGIGRKVGLNGPYWGRPAILKHTLWLRTLPYRTYDKQMQFGARGLEGIAAAALRLEFMPCSRYRHFLLPCGCWLQICFPYWFFDRDASRIDVFAYNHWVLFPQPLLVPCHL